MLKVKNNTFTSVLSEIIPPVEAIFYRGVMPVDRVPCVAIVGTRKPTSYGQDVGYKIAYNLASTGLIVISGLALGIDAIAHKAALDAGGITLAVLANGVDNIIPTTNRNLGEQIIEKGGAILSEYKPGTPAMAHQFLERNRIVSGLADAVIVVEAAKRSGTLSTATHALNQGKHVFAVPGNITSPMSEGCNNLIKQGAMPITSANDVIEVLAPGRLVQTELDFIGNELENSIVSMIKEGSCEGEIIMQKLKISASEFNQLVTTLEINDVIRSLGANKWSLK